MSSEVQKRSRYWSGEMEAVLTHDVGEQQGQGDGDGRGAEGRTLPVAALVRLAEGEQGPGEGVSG